jgi:hypothetical protein
LAFRTIHLQKLGGHFAKWTTVRDEEMNSTDLSESQTPLISSRPRLHHTVSLYSGVIPSVPAVSVPRLAIQRRRRGGR